MSFTYYRFDFGKKISYRLWLESSLGQANKQAGTELRIT